MAYGIPKITAQQLKKEILDLIAVELDKDNALSGDNLSFYGADINFSLSLTLVSRGITEAKIIAITSAGESNPAQQLAGSEEKGEESHPLKKVITAAARRQIGRRNVAYQDPKNVHAGVESKPGTKEETKPDTTTDSGSSGEGIS